MDYSFLNHLLHPFVSHRHAFCQLVPVLDLCTIPEEQLRYSKQNERCSGFPSKYKSISIQVVVVISLILIVGELVLLIYVSPLSLVLHLHLAIVGVAAVIFKYWSC